MPTPEQTTSPWWDRSRHDDRRPFLLARNAMKQAISAYFLGQGFIEVETGCLQVSPGNETHLHAFATEAIDAEGKARPYYLPTSPEFACKKLLAAGETRIFTFAPAFRNRECGPLHAPAFTMLEWYRAQDGAEQYATVQKDCEEILRIAACVAHNDTARWKNRTGALTADCLRTTVPKAIADLTGIDILATLNETGEPDGNALAAACEAAGVGTRTGDTWADMFSKLLVEVEQRYGELPAMASPEGIERPLLLDGYPACQSPLARAESDEPRLAKRFEVFLSGVELANGFGEENDAGRIRAALAAEMDEKLERYGERYPVDDEFIAAVALMQPGTAGCALGFDRLVLLATGADHIDQVIWTPTGPAG